MLECMCVDQLFMVSLTLGHARPAIVFDIILGISLILDMKVRYVRNITMLDILKMILMMVRIKFQKKLKRKVRANGGCTFLPEKYHNCLKKLNCLTPSIEPRASGHIIEQIEMIERIIKNGYAYIVNGSVYMDVIKYNDDHNIWDIIR